MYSNYIVSPALGLPDTDLSGSPGKKKLLAPDIHSPIFVINGFTHTATIHRSRTELFSAHLLEFPNKFSHPTQPSTHQKGMFLLLASAPKLEADGSKKSAANGQYISNQWKYSVIKKDGLNFVRLYILNYTGWNRRNGPNFGRVFLMLNYTEKTQNTYIQS